MNFHAKVILAVAVLIGAALAVIFLFAGGDEAEIEALIEEGVAAARRGDAEAVIALVSRDYRSGEQGYDDVVARIRRVVEDRRVRAAQLVGAVVTVHGEEAEASFTVEGRLGPRSLGEARVRIRLRREEDGWRVTSAERVTGPTAP